MAPGTACGPGQTRSATLGASQLPVYISELFIPSIFSVFECLSCTCLAVFWKQRTCFTDPQMERNFITLVSLQLPQADVWFHSSIRNLLCTRSWAELWAQRHGPAHRELTAQTKESHI